MSPRCYQTSYSILCSPRVSGDEPAADELVFTARRFSPRERG